MQRAGRACIAVMSAMLARIAAGLQAAGGSAAADATRRLAKARQAWLLPMPLLPLLLPG